jgi:hypothetical protein
MNRTSGNYFEEIIKQSLRDEIYIISMPFYRGNKLDRMYLINKHPKHILHQLKQRYQQ